MNKDGRKYHLYQECIRGGEILMTLLTQKMVILQGKEEQLLDGRELKVQHPTRTSCVGGKAIKWSMIIQFIEARMVFLIMNSIYILEELRMLLMTTTHLSRDFMKV